MVVHIVKIFLHDEQPIISCIDVAEGEYMVASKKKEGGDIEVSREGFFHYKEE